MININRNTNVYSNIHSSENSFLFRGNLAIQFNYEPNEQFFFFRTAILSKKGILKRETTK